MEFVFVCLYFIFYIYLLVWLLIVNPVVLFQFMAVFHRKKLNEDDLKINTLFPKICDHLTQVLLIHLFRLS